MTALLLLGITSCADNAMIPIVYIHDAVPTPVLCTSFLVWPNHIHLEFPSSKCRLPVERVCLFRGVLILLPNLDRLVRLSSDETQAGFVECRAHDTCFSFERTRLCDTFAMLEPMACLPVVERGFAVVATGEHDVILIYRECVDDAVDRREVLHEIAVRA